VQAAHGDVQAVHADVAVVGVGPAGSVAAQRLASAGCRVVLLERATFPRDKACGDGVSDRGLAVLARSGLGEWASTFPAPKVLRLTSPEGRVLDVRPQAVGGRCQGRTIPRRLLDARLALFAPRLLERVFRRMQQERELALLVGTIVIGYRSPRAALRPTTLLRLLA
jgi:flavin-dependent dehydrogenase